MVIEIPEGLTDSETFAWFKRQLEDAYVKEDRYQSTIKSMQASIENWQKTYNTAIVVQKAFRMLILDLAGQKFDSSEF